MICVCHYKGNLENISVGGIRSSLYVLNDVPLTFGLLALKPVDPNTNSLSMFISYSNGFGNKK